MKRNLSFILIFICFLVTYSQATEKVIIPKGVIYNYADLKIDEEARKLIQDSLKDNNYSLIDENLMIGPTLWKRFKNIKALNEIKGNVIFHIDDEEVEGKMSKNISDSRKIWDEIRKEVSGAYKIRKANEAELKYFWATISFDIDEPLFILETKSHNYILNFIRKDLKLFWIDEVEIKNSYNNEVYATPKRNKETKLEKVVLLNNDKELRENSSAEDIKTVISKTNKIFEDLFRNSQKSGKIIIQFELATKKNEVRFAVRDDLDLDIMKEFEKRVNNEKYPNTKRKSVKIQLIYKVNSFDDSE